MIPNMQVTKSLPVVRSPWVLVDALGKSKVPRAVLISQTDRKQYVVHGNAPRSGQVYL
jgi:hypothetical protein